MATLTSEDRKQIRACLKRYQEAQIQNLLEKSGSALMSALRDDPALKPYVHFIKFRVARATCFSTAETEAPSLSAISR